MGKYIDAEKIPWTDDRSGELLPDVWSINGGKQMTMHDVLEYAEYSLREDKEYWAQMDKLKTDIDNLIYRYNKQMAAALIRLAVTMITERSNSKCVDCTGGYCEEECLTDEK